MAVWGRNFFYRQQSYLQTMQVVSRFTSLSGLP
jgi:hypothetical protein